MSFRKKAKKKMTAEGTFRDLSGQGKPSLGWI